MGDILWKVVQACWTDNPCERYTMSEAVVELSAPEAFTLATLGEVAK